MEINTPEGKALAQALYDKHGSWQAVRLALQRRGKSIAGPVIQDKDDKVCLRPIQWDTFKRWYKLNDEQMSRSFIKFADRIPTIVTHKAELIPQSANKITNPIFIDEATGWKIAQHFRSTSKPMTSSHALLRNYLNR